MDQDRHLGRLYRKGETLFRQEEPADSLFVIQEGRVEAIRRLEGGKYASGIFEQGEIVGETALLTPGKRRTFTALAFTEARVMRIEERLFIEKLHVDPSFAFRILRHMAQRLQDCEQAGHLPHLPEASRKKVSLRERRPQVFDYRVGYHVLLVEDDPVFADIVATWLSHAASSSESPLLPYRFELTRAGTLEQTLRLLSQEKYEAILLDLNLPDSQGLATFHRLHEAVPDTPIVVLSALDDEEQVLHAVREGAQDFLIKGRVHGPQVVQAIRFARVRHLHALQAEHDGDGASGESLLVRLRQWLGSSPFRTP